MWFHGIFFRGCFIRFSFIRKQLQNSKVCSWLFIFDIPIEPLRTSSQDKLAHWQTNECYIIMKFFLHPFGTFRVAILLTGNNLDINKYPCKHLPRISAIEVLSLAFYSTSRSVVLLYHRFCWKYSSFFPSLRLQLSCCSSEGIFMIISISKIQIFFFSSFCQNVSNFDGESVIVNLLEMYVCDLQTMRS